MDGDLDKCPEVDGPKDVAYFPGCPRLTRTVTAAYAEAAITGQVSVLGPNQAPAGTCLPTEVRAFTMQGGVAVQVGPTTTTSATGSYTITLGEPLAAGSTYYVRTERISARMTRSVPRRSRPSSRSRPSVPLRRPGRRP